MSRIIFFLILSAFSSQMFGQTDVQGCMISVACNYNPLATVDDGSCDFVSCYQLGCTDPDACNYDATALYDDGSCDYLSCLVSGCMNEAACNYNIEAEVSDGSCEFLSCAGCTNPNAPNYDATATIDDESCQDILGCTDPQACNFSSIATLNDGTCDYLSCLVQGCTDVTACNYNPEAEANDGSCEFSDTGYDCNGDCLVDTDGDGVCDMFEINGCDDVNATNYSAAVTENDGSCVYPVPGCTDFEACNYDATADVNDGSCEYTSCAGCTSPEACNYDATAIYSDESCEYPAIGYDCNGDCLIDTDGDGVCDQFEVMGCTDQYACNYDENATDSGSCSYPLANYDCDGNSLLPIFSGVEANITVQCSEVQDINDVIIDASISPFAPAYVDEFTNGDCYAATPNPTVTVLSELVVDGNCANNYTIFRTWHAEDCNGFEATVQQIVTVVDTITPTLNIPADQNISCDAITELTDFGSATATDNCGSVEISINEAIVTGLCAGSYEIHRTFTATDLCSNSTSATQVITVSDTIAPVVTAPDSYTVECSNQIQYAPATATDNCGTYSISVNENIIPGGAAGNYTIVRTFMAVDDCGNIGIDTQTITVVDTTAPSLTVPASYTAECTDELTYADAVAFDNCGEVSINVADEVIPGNAAGNYTIVRTFTASDDAGNESTGTQTITVVDTTAPVIQAPDNYTIECDQFEAQGDPVATDNCGEVTINSSDLVIEGESAGNYTVVRTFTATDDAGNVSFEATQTITVVDTTAPELTIPADYTAECSDELVYADATATDNCSNASISVYELTVPGNAAGNYEIIREFTASDESGNSVTLSQTITVVDTTAPSFDSTPADITVECGFIPVAETLTASDNCGEVIISLFEATVEGACEGTYTVNRTWTATDDAGNSISYTQAISVEDTTAPVFVQTADVELSCSEALILAEINLEPGCSSETLSVEETTVPGACPQSYSIVRVYTAVDACGNTSEYTHTTTIVDNTAPVVADGTCFGLGCPVYISELDGESLPSPSLSISDECDDAPTWTAADAAASTDDVAALNLAGDQIATTRTYTLVDACGNESVLAQTFVTTLIVEGCTDSAACNYDSVANTEDGSCEYCSCGFNACGCMDDSACNYDSTAVYDDGGCTYAEVGYDCDGNCLDTNNNQICDFNEYGCMDPVACNYDATALVEDGSCDYCNCDLAPQITSSNSNYSLEVELVTTHSEGNLAGLSTYRVYIHTPNNTDQVSAVSGNDIHPLSLSTTTSFYQDVFGSNVSTSISPAMMAVAPEVAYDSWVTIGAASSADETNGVVNLMPGDWGVPFSEGNSFTVNDAVGSGWYLLPPGGANGSAGDDNRVLLAQLTTNGTVSGSFSVQIFPEGDQVNDDRVDFTFTQQPLGTYSCPEIVSGPINITVECDAVPAAPSLSDFEVYTDPSVECDGSELVLELYSEEISAGSCPDSYVITREYGITNCTGSTTEFTQIVTVVDTTAPELTIPADYTAECSDEHPMEAATATDNCGEVTIDLVEVTTPGACAGDYTITRTFTATDECGNSTTDTQTVTIIDTTAPVFTFVPANYTAECSDEHPMEAATATDNCGEVEITVESVTTPGACAGDYTITRTFTATDDCGNSTTATQVITIIDTTSPEFTSVPADYTAECSDEHPMEAATATDNCGEIAITVDAVTTPGACSGDYTITRTFTATDDCGNATTAVQVITIIDTTAPVLSIPADYTAECSDDHPMEAATATDNCGEVAITVDAVTTPGACTGDYTITRTFTATDDCGNATTAVQVITIIDTTAPVLSIPADYTAECSDDHPMEAATATDHCGEVTIEVVEATIPGACAGDYTITRTFTATDDCGNSTTAVQVITIIDTTSPVLSIPADYTAECSDEHPMEAATATDNCGEVTIEVVEATIPGACAGDYTITRTFTATDDCGNATTATQVITIIDTTSPEFTSVPADYTAECSDEHPMEDAVATDSCGEVTIALDEIIVAGDCAGDYNIIRAFSATDDCGNSTTVTQMITIIDTTAPVLSIPADYTAECSDDHPMEAATATDNCGEVTIEVVEATIPGACTGDYTITRTFTATDDCGNSTTAVQVITIIDTTSPEFTSVPADYTAECSDEHPMEAATATDNCGEVEITVESVTTPGACAGDYTITRTFTATDDCGNSTTAVQVITIIDTTAPVLSIPADYTAECSAEHPMDDATATDNCGEVTIEVVEATTPGACAGEYTITRTFTATDDCGNSTTATQTITIIDTTAPEFFEVPADYTTECDEELVLEDAVAMDNCSLCNTDFEFESTAAGYGIEVETVAFHTEGDLEGLTTYRVYLTTPNANDQVTSFTGNDEFPIELTTTTSFYQNVFGGVTPNDITSDAISLVPELAYDSWVTIGLSQSPEAGEGSIGVIPGTWSETFENGNSFTVNDGIGSGWYTVPPTAPNGLAGDDHKVLLAQLTTDGQISGSFRTQVFPNGDQVNDVRPDITFEQTGSCNELVIELDETIENGCGSSYVLTRTWTATDACGNSSSESQVITVVDTTAPELTIPADYTAECSDEHPMDNATATDNCAEVVITVEESIVEGSCTGEYQIHRTFTATDECGNSSTDIQVIQIVDTTAPVIFEVPADYTIECDQELILEEAVVTDNCSTCNSGYSVESSVDGYGIEVETVMVHTEGDLAGLATYRVYVTVPSSADQVTSCTGNDEYPLSLSTTTSFYQNMFGGVTPNDISAGALALVPELAYDSWVTVGLTQAPTAGQGTVGIIPGDWSTDFENGNSFTVNDGIGSGWYVSPPDAANGLAGSDNRVLIAQLTTDGAISGSFRTQVFPNGDQANDVRPDMSFNMSGTCNDLIVVVDETIENGCGSSYVLTRTWTATDACGNSSSESQVITVVDTTAPELTLPADYTAECSDDHPMEAASATDNCGEVVIDLVEETLPGLCAGDYTITRTFTATDDCGNSTTATQTITIIDTTAPEFFEVPADYTTECDEELVLEDAVAMDNCSMCNTTFDYESTEAGYGIEVETVTFHTEGELAGLTTYRVYMTLPNADDQITSFTGNDEYPLSLSTTTSFYQNVLGGATPNDISSQALSLVPELAYDSWVTIGLSQEPVAGQGAVNLIPGSWASSFEAGNSFTVNDGIGSGWYTVPPTATNGQAGDDLKVLVAQLTTDGQISGSFRTQVFPNGDQVNDVRPDITFEQTGSCNELVIELDETIDNGCGSSYVLTRTWTATDACGNATSASQVITVVDTTAPVLTLPADYTAECSDEHPMDNATATDNCAEVVITVEESIVEGSCTGEYQIHRTFTATDECGNSSTDIQVIQIVDTTAPEFFEVPADYTTECDEELVLEDAVAMDNCSMCNTTFDYESTEAGYGIEVETVTFHTEGELAGLTTYRVYMTLPNADDQITSFTGNDEYPLSLSTTTSFYQNVLGGATPNDISSQALSLVPELAYDSWVTIGLSQESVDGQGAVNLIPGSWASSFEAGNSFTVNDGIGSGWYTVPPTATNGQAGDDLKVLVAQLTTDGQISGSFRTQVFPNGDQVNDVRPDIHSSSLAAVTS